MKLIMIILCLIMIGTFSSNVLNAQSIFFEPVIGLYKPSDISFDGNYSPRFGGNIGLILKNDFQVYGGYKMWLNEYDDINNYNDPITIGTKAHFFSVGGRKIFPLQIPIDLRFGGEFLFSNFEVKYDDINYPQYNYTANGSGIGFSIEGGSLFSVGNIQFFAGINYLILEVEYNEFTIGGHTYSPNELGISKEESKIEGNCPIFKISAIFSL